MRWHVLLTSCNRHCWKRMRIQKRVTTAFHFKHQQATNSSETNLVLMITAMELNCQTMKILQEAIEVFLARTNSVLEMFDFICVKVIFGRCIVGFGSADAVRDALHTWSFHCLSLFHFCLFLLSSSLPLHLPSPLSFSLLLLFLFSPSLSSFFLFPLSFSFLFFPLLFSFSFYSKRLSQEVNICHICYIYGR